MKIIPEHASIEIEDKYGDGVDIKIMYNDTIFKVYVEGVGVEFVLPTSELIEALQKIGRIVPSNT